MTVLGVIVALLLDYYSWSLFRPKHLRTGEYFQSMERLAIVTVMPWQLCGPMVMAARPGTGDMPGVGKPARPWDPSAR